MNPFDQIATFLTNNVVTGLLNIATPIAVIALIICCLGAWIVGDESAKAGFKKGYMVHCCCSNCLFFSTFNHYLDWNNILIGGFVMKYEGKKKFAIPRQISKEFHVWRFITFKEALFLTIGVVIGYLIYAYMVPSDTNIQIKVFVVTLPPTLIGLLLMVKPIKTRKNIRLFHFIKWKIDFNNRQKVFYYKKG